MNDAKSLRTLVLVDLPLGNVAERDKAGAFGDVHNVLDLRKRTLELTIREMVTDGELVSLASTGPTASEFTFAIPRRCFP